MSGVGAVILAAGASTRFGEPKQLLAFNGESLVQRAVHAATESGCMPVVVVTGAAAEQVQRDLAGPLAELVHNTDWERGLGTSIRRGIEHLSQSDVGAVVLLACDQPLVNANSIGRLIAEYRTSRKAIVASSYAGTIGIPALFDRSCFAALLALPATSGAKPLIESRSRDVAKVEFAAAAVDIDTRADLDNLKASQAKRRWWRALPSGDQKSLRQ
jgi:molybdenum cofactor cytidylyltransferase